MKYIFLYFVFGLAVVVAEVIKEYYIAKKYQYDIYIDRKDVRAMVAALCFWPFYVSWRLVQIFK